MTAHITDSACGFLSEYASLFLQKRFRKLGTGGSSLLQEYDCSTDFLKDQLISYILGRFYTVQKPNFQYMQYTTHDVVQLKMEAFCHQDQHGSLCPFLSQLRRATPQLPSLSQSAIQSLTETQLAQASLYVVNTMVLLF